MGRPREPFYIRNWKEDLIGHCWKLWVVAVAHLSIDYLTRLFCGGPICDDRNFGGPKIWRNWTKTVTFRTSQKIRVFFIILFSDTKEIQKFLKIGKIMLKQNETYKSISSSSSKGSGSTLSYYLTLNSSWNIVFICPTIISLTFQEQNESMKPQLLE